MSTETPVCYVILHTAENAIVKKIPVFKLLRPEFAQELKAKLETKSQLEKDLNNADTDREIDEKHSAFQEATADLFYNANSALMMCMSMTDEELADALTSAQREKALELIISESISRGPG
jgi:hypothetical protein